MKIMPCLVVGVVTGVFVCALTAKVSANLFTEYQDVGQTLASSQLLQVGTEIITGALHGSDVDMFGFGWGGGDFYADSLGSTFDSKLFLFESTGGRPSS